MDKHLLTNFCVLSFQLLKLIGIIPATAFLINVISKVKSIYCEFDLPRSSESDYSNFLQVCYVQLVQLISQDGTYHLHKEPGASDWFYQINWYLSLQNIISMQKHSPAAVQLYASDKCKLRAWTSVEQTPPVWRSAPLRSIGTGMLPSTENSTSIK